MIKKMEFTGIYERRRFALRDERSFNLCREPPFFYVNMDSDKVDGDKGEVEEQVGAS